jgi:hyperosmotically inducible periplasmic protein
MQAHLLKITLGAAMMLVTAACTETPKTEAKMSNDELERLVAAKINGEPQLTAYDLKVSGDVDKNEVTISGAVPSEGLRTLAVDLANTGRVGLNVTSKIDVKPGEVERKDFSEDMARETRDRAKETGESVGSSIEDAWIHTKVRSKLLREGEFPGGSVNVDVKDNAVTLRGDVSTAENKAKAGEIARSIDGVKSVNNRLVIKPKP